MNPCEVAVTTNLIAIAIFNSVPLEDIPAILATLGQITTTLGNMARVAGAELAEQAKQNNANNTTGQNNNCPTNNTSNTNQNATNNAEANLIEGDVIEGDITEEEAAMPNLMSIQPGTIL